MSYNTIHDPKIPGIKWERIASIPVLFGLDPKKHLPNGLAPRMVNGIKMWIEPKTVYMYDHPRPPMKLRALCECPICFKVVSIGRLGQHAKIHRS
jgi:hypothetical protein